MHTHSTATSYSDHRKSQKLISARISCALNHITKYIVRHTLIYPGFDHDTAEIFEVTRNNLLNQKSYTIKFMQKNIYTTNHNALNTDGLVTGYRLHKNKIYYYQISYMSIQLTIVFSIIALNLKSSIDRYSNK